MRAIIAKPNAPLEIQEIEIPKPKPNEVLIKINAAGINRPDLLPVSYTHLDVYKRQT